MHSLYKPFSYSIVEMSKNSLILTKIHGVSDKGFGFMVGTKNFCIVMSNFMENRFELFFYSLIDQIYGLYWKGFRFPNKTETNKTITTLLPMKYIKSTIQKREKKFRKTPKFYYSTPTAYKWMPIKWHQFIYTLTIKPRSRVVFAAFYFSEYTTFYTFISWI